VFTSSGALPVANVAHGAGAAIGWLIGTATLKKRERLYLAILTAAVLSMTFVVMYMPWNKTYIGYRIVKALRHMDSAQAQYWIRKWHDVVRKEYPFMPPADAAQHADDAADG
jgi:hypothetical protein